MEIILKVDSLNQVEVSKAIEVLTKLIIENKPEKIKSVGLRELTPLTTRTINVLEAEGIYTLEELLDKSPNQLLRLPNFGKTSLRNVNHALELRKIQTEGK
jgi:DNA-directed RNA polymerase alpha subunit